MKNHPELMSLRVYLYMYAHGVDPKSLHRGRIRIFTSRLDEIGSFFFTEVRGMFTLQLYGDKIIVNLFQVSQLILRGKFDFFTNIHRQEKKQYT